MSTLTTPSERRAFACLMFKDETPCGPLMKDGSFSLPSAATVAEMERAHTAEALRQLHLVRNRVFEQRRARQQNGRKLPPDAVRMRAPKRPRLPADLTSIDPKDYRTRLKAEGFTTASGVRYFMALLKMQGEGNSVIIPASTNLPAHTMLEKVRKFAGACGWNPRLYLSCCPKTCGLTVRWLATEEVMPEPYRSRFGLDMLVGSGEFVDIGVDVFPSGMRRTVQVRAVYLDHALARRNVKRAMPPQIDVLPEDQNRPETLTAVLKSPDHDLRFAASLLR